MLFEYISILVTLVLSVLIGCVLLGINYLISPNNADVEKLSAYECGFNPYGDARQSFDVRFYLVAILFIVFDLEVIFLYPWALTFIELGALGFWIIMLFLFVLTIGFIYEWQKGALEWQ